ncbi:ATP-binding cassette sub-family B member 8, mitochondrial [Amphibalanus amphitrite]|uniref:Mitochondrial potassium channel ATP-binding subunit n=2 Tax=Amphibalanus amphitrite TaxID=1232801 RepID=A0A6A4W0K7_AMPAM|nr:mitochondrial potassium channel ATP-binding subunit-like isoform X1 [Amphibalanus amphitrite]XP_043234495.1 mitochondrial potassium channel ATP-binding subunit-like isoform X1 [Amphibalanus amphitrite]XP_043234496.1 mitochondrial potassium channel ATP-binding subunit-like isoform X1 [Amphibalanus amphitrite]KAF0299443.1 ATP-binding cassette sub-family B member 8, mitochondrial [Amphibalanus amphitrite]
MLSSLIRLQACRTVPLKSTILQATRVPLRTPVNRPVTRWAPRQPVGRAPARSGRPVPPFSILPLGLSVSAVCVWRWRLGSVTARCEHEHSRVVPEEPATERLRLDWRRLWSLLRPYLHYLIGAVCSAAIVALCNVEIPRLLGDLINVLTHFASAEGGGLHFTDELRAPALRLISFYGLQSLFTFAYIVCLSYMGEGMAADLRSQLFSVLMQQDVAFYDHHKTGEVINRLTTDVQDFKSSFKMCVSQGMRSVAQVLGCVAALYHMSPQLTLGSAVVITSVISVGTLIGRGLRELSREAQQQVAHSTAVAEEAVGNVRTVRAFAMEDSETEIYVEEVNKSRDMHIRLGIGIGCFQAGANLFMNSVVLATLYYGGYLMSMQQLSAGDLMSFLVASQTIQRSLAQMSILFGTFVRGMSAGARVFEYINLKSEIPIRGGDIIPVSQLTGSVEFRDVTFSYPTRPGVTVLDGLQLKVPSGHMLALVGYSGGGKSTCAALLERFYDPVSGQVLLDGHDLRSLDPHWLRGRVIGYINQEPVLFATSIRENIRYGREDATDEEVMQAARLANAHHFISDLPDGYDTAVGERGVTLSGGQKQRVAIARALLKDPRILVLDEATSALDAESEKVVQEALDRVVTGRTVLVIAHRLSTVRHADCIAVIANGRVAEMGSHAELVKKKGLYWDLVKHNTLQGEGGVQADTRSL